MAAPTPDSPPDPESTGRAGRADPFKVRGWIAVGLSTLAAGFGVMMLAGYAVTDPPTAANWTEGLLPMVLVVVLVGLGPLAVRFSRAGVGYLVFGLYACLKWGSFGLVAGLICAATGPLYIFGRPQPRWLAYVITVGVPILGGIVIGLVLLLTASAAAPPGT
jgi:exosortase/archaeosortase